MNIKDFNNMRIITEVDKIRNEILDNSQEAKFWTLGFAQAYMSIYEWLDKLKDNNLSITDLINIIEVSIKDSKNDQCIYYFNRLLKEYEENKK